MEEINSKIKEACIDSQGNGILESLEFYKEFIELANFAFLVINPDNKILYCNSTAANLFGIDNAELKSLTIFDLFSQIKSYTIEEESLVQNYIDGKNIKNKVVSIKRKDNSQIWINLCLKPIINENKQIICTVLTGLDISRQMQLDQKLEKSEERYRSIFNSINSGV
ncbi:MAG: PAS domain-containing protein, partial [Candidatus Lokiarchaeota archaeon]|nr:PAS domain-containing protein [Candidatus Lokiarchaeota archaeon]